MDLQALRSQSINKIREQFDELSGEQLTQLRAMESAEEAPRATLIKAIDDKFEELKAINDKLKYLSGTSPASDDEPLTASQAGLSPAASQDNPPPKPPGAGYTAAAPAVEAPRATLVKAIDDKLEELGATSPASDTESNTQAPPESEGANDPVEAAAPQLGVDSTGEAPASSGPAWQAPDYCGPLTGDQALWRVANLKAR